MIKRWCIISFTVFLATITIDAQEVITGTFSNPKLSNNSKKSYLKALKTTPLSLPFYDDFSSGESLPDNNLWDDSYVFINNTFSKNQVTRGMATFDALDEKGALYSGASSIVFAADTLTSLPVNLEYIASDSIYLSFLFEPGGLGDSPEANDSLTLDFFSPSELKWNSVWRTTGSGNNAFSLRMFSITDPKYLQNGFRFRFINYASLSSAATEPAKAGNADQWNLDCVILDKGRKLIDTIMPDVAFTTPLRSLLNNIEAMPLNQFKKASLIAMGSSFDFNIRNNEDIERNQTRNYIIKDVYNNTIVRETLQGATNIAPLSDTLITEDLLYTFTPEPSADSALFLIKSVLHITETDDRKENDTISYYQSFSDYFAYDDGTAEGGYGINGEGSDNAMVALRYRSYIQDSVSGIRICFNDAINNANQRYFYMMVWADAEGRPGEVLATSEELLAMPSGKNNGFVTFRFNKPLPVDGYFWVGWKQASETFLNVGLDMNTPHQNRLWYWINGNWYTSSAPGTILLRAVMAGEGSLSSSDDNERPYNSRFSLFPNPVTESFTVSCPDNRYEAFKLTLYSISGSMVMNTDETTDVNIKHLPAGNYLVVVKSSANKPLSVLKLIKSQ